jgi:hypothetical protein
VAVVDPDSRLPPPPLASRLHIIRAEGGGSSETLVQQSTTAGINRPQTAKIPLVKRTVRVAMAFPLACSWPVGRPDSVQQVQTATKQLQPAAEHGFEASGAPGPAVYPDALDASE